MEMGKKHISVIIARVAKKIEYLIKTQIFHIRATTDKIELAG